MQMIIIAATAVPPSKCPLGRGPGGRTVADPSTDSSVRAVLWILLKSQPILIPSRGRGAHTGGAVHVAAAASCALEQNGQFLSSKVATDRALAAFSDDIESQTANSRIMHA